MRPDKISQVPVAKGDGSEFVWASLFRKYLPKRYVVDKATISATAAAI